MHFPVEIGFGNFKVSAHLVCEMLAFTIGFRYFLYLRKRTADIISDSNRVTLLIAATFGAFFFSRLIGALESPLGFYQSQNKLLFFYANKTIIGGLLGGLIGVEIVKKIIGVKTSSGDLFTYPLILAMIIGRIGCFSTGIHEATYGIETSSALGMDLGDGLHRHPVALYEIVFLSILFTCIQILERKHRLMDGYRFQLFMVSYLLFRLLLDFIKPKDAYFYGLGTIQLCCIIGLMYYYKMIFRLFYKPSSIFIYA